ATIMVTLIVVLAVIAGRRHVRAQDAPIAVIAGTHAAPHAIDDADQSPRVSPMRASAAALRGGWRGGLTLAIACGVLDAIANIIVLAGLRLGDLTVVSVLTALYPAGTILLAAIVLRERIAPLQWLGLALALAASAMLAAA
ncbi:MAG: EamA family transporter, partial [Microcella sp.]|nr:EamA family transporter [Microcella sp.]